MIDLGPAAQHMAQLVEGVRDDQLQAPTPCTAYAVGDLLDHIGGLTLAFTAAARKSGEMGDQAPSADASRLGSDWRTRIPANLPALADAWRDPEAWTGMTKAGGVELPGEVGGLVALNELVVHGWDLARGSDQLYQWDDRSVAACRDFVAQFSGPGSEAARGDAFAAVVEVPDEAPVLDQLIGLSGRDPAWSPGTGGG